MNEQLIPYNNCIFARANAKFLCGHNRNRNSLLALNCVNFRFVHKNYVNETSFFSLVDIEFLFCRSLQVKPLSQANYTCKVVKQKKNCGNHTQAHFLLLLSFKLIKKRIALLRLTYVERTFPEYVNFLSHFIAIKSVHPQNRWLRTFVIRRVRVEKKWCVCVCQKRTHLH